MPNSLAPLMILYTSSPINLKNTGATLLFNSINSSSPFFPSLIRIYTNNATGIVTPPTLSIGTNASSYNNIRAVTLTTASASGQYVDYLPSYPLAPLAANAEVYVNVTIAAIATTYSARFAIYGNTT